MNFFLPPFYFLKLSMYHAFLIIVLSNYVTILIFTPIILFLQNRYYSLYFEFHKHLYIISNTTNVNNNNQIMALILNKDIKSLKKALSTNFVKQQLSGNASLPISVTLFGIVIFVSDEHPEKAKEPIFVTL